MKYISLIALSLLLSGLYAATASACGSGTVRDAAFQEKRDIHRLCLFTKPDEPDAAETAKRLEHWIDTKGKAINVKFEQVNVDDETIQWNDYGIPSAPPTLPAVALVGVFPSPRRPFVIDHWTPPLTDGDLDILATSPAREAITDHIVDSWAVLLYSPQPKNWEEKNPVESILDAVVKHWAEEQPPGLAMVRFDRSDPRERILCAFIGGLGPSDPNWVGVVFGRGKLMAPPLRGDDITENNLNQLLTALTVPCTCLQESLTLGLDIPMKWDETLDAQITSIAPPEGYVEVPIGEQRAVLENEVPDEGKYLLATALIPLGAGLVVAMSAIALMVWRAKRHAGLRE